MRQLADPSLLAAGPGEDLEQVRAEGLDSDASRSELEARHADGASWYSSSSRE
jgi:hypothetical protein